MQRPLWESERVTIRMAESPGIKRWEWTVIVLCGIGGATLAWIASNAAGAIGGGAAGLLGGVVFCIRHRRAAGAG